MGKIRKVDGGVEVTFNAEELLSERAYIKLPTSELRWFDHIGNMISRAAWRKILEKAPELWTEYKVVKVLAKGTFTITFLRENEFSEPLDETNP